MANGGFTPVEGFGRQGYIIDPKSGLPIFGVNLPDGFRQAGSALTPELRGRLEGQFASQESTDFAKDFLGQLMGLSESSLAMQGTLLETLLGLSEESAQFGRDRFAEISPLRNALIGALRVETGERRRPVRQELGLKARQINKTRELFDVPIEGALEANERGLSLAREEVLSSTPGRGGGLQAALTEIPLERARTRTGLVQAADDIRRQRVMSLASAFGLQAPELAFTGLAQGIGGASSGAGIAGQTGLGALSAGLQGAVGMRGQDLGQVLGLAELMQQNRLATTQAEAGKKGATGQGVGSAAGGIGAGLIIAYAI